MSLTIHTLATDQAEYYGVEKTISIREESTSGVNMVVTVEEEDDLPILFQFLDAFINRRSNLLPDYNSKKITCGQPIQVVIVTGNNYVTIFFHDLKDKANGVTITYAVPPSAQKEPLQAVERYKSLPENLN